MGGPGRDDAHRGRHLQGGGGHGGAGAGAGAGPEQRAADIFRIMDVNNDGRVTRAEFVRTCLNDQKLLNLLTPNTE